MAGNKEKALGGALSVAVNLSFIFLLSFYFLTLSQLAVAVAALALSVVLLFSIFKQTPVFPRILMLSLFVFFFTSLELTAFLISLVTLIALISVFLRFGPRWRVLPVILCSVLAGGILYYLTVSIPVALTPLVALVPALLNSISMRMKAPRTYTVALTAFGFAAVLVPMFLATVYKFNGALNADIIKEVFDGYRNELTSYLIDLDFSELLPMQEEPQKVFTEEGAAIIASYAFNLAIGIIALVCSVISHFATSLAINLTVAFGKRESLERDAVRFRMSAVSGALFIVALIVNLFASFMSSRNAEIASYAAMNFYIIMLPGMLMTALTYIKEWFAGRKEPLRLGILSIVLILIIFFSFSSVCLVAVAGFGAIRSIIEEVKGPTVPPKDESAAQ